MTKTLLLFIATAFVFAADPPPVPRRAITICGGDLSSGISVSEADLTAPSSSYIEAAHDAMNLAAEVLARLQP